MKFRLLIDLVTPIILSSHLTLDGVLSAAIYNATGLMGEDTIPHIPLERGEQDIFRGSALFVDRQYRYVETSRVMALRTERDLSVDAFSPNGRGGRYIAVDQKRGPNKINLSTYQSIQTPTVSFWGVGDGERAQELIQTFIPGLGKRAMHGAGEIGAVTLIEEDEDYSWTTRRGDPARPLPVDVWRSIGGRPDASVSPEMAVRLPYWDSPLVEAVFPNRLDA